jgi:hypothetical protein
LASSWIFHSRLTIYLSFLVYPSLI